MRKNLFQFVELTFSLYKDGSIVKADMKTNPGTKLALWKVKPEQGRSALFLLKFDLFIYLTICYFFI